ncbi:MAG: PEGA domain-containing protein [Myxococcales bacterium]
MSSGGWSCLEVASGCSCSGSSRPAPRRPWSATPSPSRRLSRRRRPPPPPRHRSSSSAAACCSRSSPRRRSLFIGNERVGRASDLASTGGFLKLDPGIYQVSLKLPGYATWRAEVTVREGQAETIRATMVAK